MTDSTKPFVVALTGGIASGKTAVSDRFARLGVPVIDTDVIARQIVEPGQPSLQRVVELFGASVLEQDGSLNRSRLRKIVFECTDKRKALEAILHPEIIRLVKEAISNVKTSYCIVVIPLLAERGKGHNFIDHVLLVDADETTQLSRLKARDGINETQAKRMLSAQASRPQRLQIADDVIANTGDLSDLDDQIAQLHRSYCAH